MTDALIRIWSGWSSWFTEERRLALAERWGPRSVNRIQRLVTALGLAAIFWYAFQVPTYPHEPHPKGLALVLPGENFTWLHQPEHYQLASWLLIGGAVLLVANRLLWLALPLLTILHLGIGTLMNSQQEEPGHKYQLVALVALTLWFWDWFDRWRRRREPGRGWGLWRANSLEWWATSAWLIVQVVAATYVVSVVSKLVFSDGQWIARADANFRIQLIKTDLANYYNTLIGPRPDGLRFLVAEDASGWQRWSTRAREWLVETPYAATALLTSGLMLEALSPLALRGRVISLLLGLGLIGMHLGIQVLMQLEFEYHMALLALFFVNLPYWLTQPLPERWRQGRRKKRPVSA